MGVRDHQPVGPLFRAVDESPWRQAFGHIKACRADPVIAHPIINVEAVRRAEIVAPVDSGGKHDVRDGIPALLWQVRRPHRLRRTVAKDVRLLRREHHHPRRVAQLAPSCDLGGRGDVVGVLFVIAFHGQGDLGVAGP